MCLLDARLATTLTTEVQRGFAEQTENGRVNFRNALVSLLNNDFLSFFFKILIFKCLVLFF